MDHRILLSLATAIAVLFGAAQAAAADLLVMGAGPIEGTFKQLAAGFTRDSGHQVEGTFNTVGFLLDKLKGGAKPDILILSAAVIDDMEKAGSLAAGTRIEIGRATSGFAVRAGAPAPDISTPDAMKQTLLAARSVAYVDPAGGGTTGIFFAGLLMKLGIVDAINRKAIRPQRGAQVAEAVADGRAEIGNTNLTELVPNKGVKVIGPIPEPLGLVISYVGAVTATSANKDAARALLATLTSTDAREKFRAAGL